MYKFDEELELVCLPAVIYKQLVDELNDYGWNVLAEQVSQQLGFIGCSWIKSLDDKMNSKSSPAENLLDELNIRMCTVRTLGKLLENCKLLRALSIIHEPQALVITRQPNSNETDEVRVALGKCFKLKCQATGLPPPVYAWYHENLPLEGQNKDELSIIINSTDQEGEYKCQVTQISSDELIIDQLTSNPVCLKIKSTPVVITKQPLPMVEVHINGTLRLSCLVDSHPAPNYRWFHDNTHLKMQKSHELVIEKFEAQHEGKYYCHIFNDISEVYSEKSNVIIQLPREKAVAKIALLIANENYYYQEKLKTPQKDVAKLGQLLEQIGFQVICLLNLTTSQMKNAMKIFSSLLCDGVYGLFYFAGHGFKMQESYMLAVDAPNNFLRTDAICESELLAMILPKDPALLVVILDTCQTVPPKELNPEIHREIPKVNEYRSNKNLRNLIQAYSTSSHRPSYERLSTNCGLYITHLSKFITRDIPVQKVFEETGKSIDIWFEGKERNQIPMFALTVTKPYRLIDAIYAGKPSDVINYLETITTFPNKIIDLNFKQSGINCQLVITQLMKPYLNFVKLTLIGLNDDVTGNLYHSVKLEKNNLYRCSQKNEFHLHNPQINKGPIVISIERCGYSIGATLFQVSDHIPLLLRNL
ncbi:GSCOCG00000055001-RA-CDS [Cotesia congregata]|uniref:Similar to Malt1: Mucosa-associated lymphoid tissue lymphoma translocation protein 1 homolog (Mus musculus) n=1 Tax=Cotesia congregata TaxID=51543 RepID=A0A8J2HJI1_COTCN|nr:GSCOCG00000055001-RA-CDS [Cotesia congregata]CAG5100982.1 Similar to Malt1: Mucosa-associated lymphoid tissue lymphoma translocation protein 1 homolog (Mus musculus) [Cotesia congregata]